MKRLHLTKRTYYAMKRRSSEKRTTEDNDDKGEKIWATNK